MRNEDEQFRNALLAALPRGAPAPDERQLLSMHAWHHAVVEANQRFNLTRITELAEAAVKHFADSLAVLAWCEKGVRSLRPEECEAYPSGAAPSHPVANEAKAPDPFFSATVLDVGTGAGFPAAPLAIMRPDWRITAIDSTGKKARFVSDTAARLGLANLTALHARAGLWKPPAPFDLVLFKAVGSMDECLDAARGLVRRGGAVVHFKTAAAPKEEVAAAEKAARRLGFTPATTLSYQLRFREERMERALWVFLAETGARGRGS